MLCLFNTLVTFSFNGESSFQNLIMRKHEIHVHHHHHHHHGNNNRKPNRLPEKHGMKPPSYSGGIYNNFYTTILKYKLSQHKINKAIFLLKFN